MNNDNLQTECCCIDPSRFHTFILIPLYLITTIISYLIISHPESVKNLTTLLSAGAILATFGSAINSIGSTLERDFYERARLDIDIFYKDIKKQDNPWRRWPFLARTNLHFLSNGNQLKANLKNPQIPFDVGSCKINIELPTTLEDFFDLSIKRNLILLYKHKNDALEVYANHKNNNSPTDPINEYMAYLCLYDAWKTILNFRLARYVLHFGSGLTLSSALVVVFFISKGAIS
jgi:hypothetical protein